MFGISFWEIIVILGILALLVIPSVIALVVVLVVLRRKPSDTPGPPAGKPEGGGND